MAVQNGVSTGVLFPHDLREAIDRWADENFPRTNFPGLKMSYVHTGLMYAGLKSPDALTIVKDYIMTKAPNAKLAKASKAITDLGPEERALLLRQLMEATEDDGSVEIE